MKIFTATVLTIASMIYLILTGTAARIRMIAVLIISDVGMMLALIAWLAGRPW